MLLQCLLILLIFFFFFSLNILTLWYIAGLYLISLGFLLFLDDGDIFVGFLWIIDLGVGLIFFIFILHFINFLYQKISINISKKFFYFFIFIFIFLFFFFYLFISPNNSFYNEIKYVWFFFINWYDFYSIFNCKITSDLNLLRELYFYNNSFEFFLINFMLSYAIFLAITCSFLIKVFFNYVSFFQIKNFKIMHEINSNFFIRSQNFIKQQNVSSGTRVWQKKNHSSFSVSKTILN